MATLLVADLLKEKEGDLQLTLLAGVVPLRSSDPFVRQLLDRENGDPRSSPANSAAREKFSQPLFCHIQDEALLATQADEGENEAICRICSKFERHRPLVPLHRPYLPPSRPHAR